MARPQKATVDYFPHATDHGKTMFILESKWGNDGYAAWFKILEKLGSTDGHFINCQDETAFVFLAAYCRIPESVLIEMLDTLANLNAIDRDLWRQKLIFCQHFVDGVSDAYRRRKEMLPTKEKVIQSTRIVIDDINKDIDGINPVDDGGSTERKGKGKEKKEEIKPDRNVMFEICIAWKGFVEMRENIKKPMTEYAMGLRVKDLQKLASEGHDPIAVLNQSTSANWQDLYPIKDRLDNAKPASTFSAATTKNLAAMEEFLNDKGTVCSGNDPISRDAWDDDRQAANVIVLRGS